MDNFLPPPADVVRVTHFRLEVTPDWARVEWVLSDGRYFCSEGAHIDPLHVADWVDRLWKFYRTSLARNGLIFTAETPVQ